MNKLLIILVALILSACDTKNPNYVLDCATHKTGWVYSAYMTSGGVFFVKPELGSYYYYPPKPGEICKIIRRNE